MTRPSTPPPILSELRNPSSPANQVAALRALKNDIIGHEEKKQMWVGLGAVALIARILNTQKGNGKRKYKEVNGGENLGGRRTNRTEEEETRLQAVIIVGSLAQGGPAYLHPLTAGAIFPPLLGIINPTESHPQLVLAALRALNGAADSSLLEQTHADSDDNSFINLLYSDHHLSSLVSILGQTSPALIVQQQISLAASLIIKTCREESHRTLLAQAGILEALSTKLASFIVATGYSLYALHGLDPFPGCSIPPATNKSRLAPILQAIGTIISKSKQRTKQFFSSPAFVEVFPGVEASRDTSTPSRSTAYNGLHGHQHAANGGLPSQSSSPHGDAPTHTLSFPPLGVAATGRGNGRSGRSFMDSMPADNSYGTESNESPLIAWLFHVVRAETAVTRLMASWLLTILYRMGLVNHRSEAKLALLLVPLLVRMLDKDYQISQDTPSSYDVSVLHSVESLILQQAPAVLSMLVEDNFKLQQAAVDAGAIRKLSQLLKQSYDPLPATSNSSLWSPSPSQINDNSSHGVISGSKLGEAGFSPQAYHVVRMRESVLIALAAMATAKDDYRKSIIDNGVVPFVIESLKPSSKSSTDAVVNGGSTNGNPIPVLLAACGAARALSRSVNTLRKSLIDAGLAAPLFVLLRHPDIEVQVAATAVVCNLLLEFSPMREAMIEAGVLKILCEHAHSTNARLRLNAVWGLKHLVHTAPNNLKMNCVEELGAGWLKQIISNDAEDAGYPTGYRNDREVGSGVAMGMGTPNAAGEQVDLLNAVEEESTGSAMGADEDDEDEVNMIDSIGALSKPENRPSSQHLPGHPESKATAGIDHRRRLTSAIDLEIQERLQARKDDISVQEQALNLIQNLICGPGASEMVDYIFQELGQDKFFDILATRLVPKVPDLFRRDRRSSENNLRHIPPPPEIVKAVCYIVVHIAASSPKHRQLLMAQSELILLLVPLFSHANKEIRAACAWLVINLTWIDDQMDRAPCKVRAYELRRMGVVDKLEEMESDPELDVRERTKTALHQMSELLRGVS